MSFEDIRRELPSLPSDQLIKLQKDISALLSLSAKPEHDTRNDWLLDGIIYELENRGLKKTIPPEFKIKSVRSFQNFPEKSLRMQEFLKDAMPVMSRAERIAVGRLCAKALSMYIEKFAPINLHTMLNLVDRIPAALEEQFPGYIQTGMLRFILKGTRRAG
jgi:hypothetical protein